jgi:hypothetical protein
MVRWLKMDRQIDGWTDRQQDRQTERQSDRQTARSWDGDSFTDFNRTHVIALFIN